MIELVFGFGVVASWFAVLAGTSWLSFRCTRRYIAREEARWIREGEVSRALAELDREFPG